MFGLHKPQLDLKPKKTPAQVEADLLKSVCEQANASLKTPLPLDNPPTTDNLRNVFIQLVAEKFQDEYAYPFVEQGSTPPDAVPGSTVQDHQATYVFHDDTAADEKSAVDHLVHDELGFPSGLAEWMADDATQELIEQCNGILKISTPGNKYSSSAFTKSYNRDAASDKYLPSVRTNTVIVFVKAHLEEDGVEANFTVLSYAGVYYDAPSPAEVARKALLGKIYAHARQLVQSEDLPALSSPPTEKDIQDVLIKYQSQQFAQYFGYDFSGSNSTPPKSQVGHVYHLSNLLSYADGNTSSFKSDVAEKITSSLPSWVSDEAQQAIVSELNSYIGADPYGDGYSWEPRKVDTSHSANPAVNPTIQNIGFVGCNASSPERHDVSFTFVFVFGVLYEGESSSSAAFDDLINRLYHSGHALLSQSVPVPDTPTEDDLKKILTDASDDQFLKILGYAFGGKDTKPPGAVEGTLIYTTKPSLVETQISGQTIASFVDDIIHKLNFPAWSDESNLRQAVRNGISQQVTRFTGKDTPATVEVSPKFDEQYKYAKDSAPNQLSTNGLFIYSNTQSWNGAPVELHVLYYIGVYYEIPNEEDGGW